MMMSVYFAHNISLLRIPQLSVFNRVFVSLCSDGKQLIPAQPDAQVWLHLYLSMIFFLA